MQEYSQEKRSERARAGWDHLHDPWEGDLMIEYWIWDGERLAPATDEERAAIEERERLQSARRRLTRWRQEEFAAHRSAGSGGVLAGIRHTFLDLWRLWHLRREHGER